MPWKPEGASLTMEAEMERQDLPEVDRDEVRRFAEYLRRRHDKEPIPPYMKPWLEGEYEDDAA